MNEKEIIECGKQNELVESIVFFFFSSRRRHTRSLRDWSSDVCSSDLRPSPPRSRRARRRTRRRWSRTWATGCGCSPRSEERRVGKSVDLGGRRIIKKKKKNKSQETMTRAYQPHHAMTADETVASPAAE